MIAYVFLMAIIGLIIGFSVNPTKRGFLKALVLVILFWFISSLAIAFIYPSLLN